MKNLLRIVFLLIMVISFSCEKPLVIVNCDECTSTEPTDGDLKIKLSDNAGGGTTIVNIYSGTIEENILIRTLTTTSSETSVSVILKKKYTVTALYYIEGNYYTAVDSATPVVGYTKSQCTDPCYYLYDNVVNLRLKYTR